MRMKDSGEFSMIYFSRIEFDGIQVVLDFSIYYKIKFVFILEDFYYMSPIKSNYYSRMFEYKCDQFAPRLVYPSLYLSYFSQY